MSFNKVLLIGNVGKDPEVRHLESGVAVASFTLATTERYKDKNGALADQTEWHNIVCWRNLAELSEKYITKGSQIFIEGKIRTRSWTDTASNQKRYTTEIVADNIRLLGKRGDNTQSSYSPDAAQMGQQAAAAYGGSQPAYQETAPGYGAQTQSYGTQSPSQGAAQNFGATAAATTQGFQAEANTEDDLPF